MPRSPSPRRREDDRDRRDSRRDDVDTPRRDRPRSRSRSRSRSPHRSSRHSHSHSTTTRQERGSRSEVAEKEDNTKGKERARERERSRSTSPRDRRDHHRSSRRRSRSRSRSRSDSSSGEGSDSEDSRERRHRKKKRSSRDKEDKEERRKRRQEKKDKKERRAKKKKGIAVVEWGKHGILTESDIYTKDQEFRSWLVEEKMINPETLSKPKMKDTFRTFMEEYNTATLPHDKYYDLAKYEIRMSAIRMGESVEVNDTYDHNKDMEHMKNSHKRVVVEQDTYLDKGRLENLRKLQNERVEMEKMKRMGIKPRDSMGIRTETKDEAGFK